VVLDSLPLNALTCGAEGHRPGMPPAKRPLGASYLARMAAGLEDSLDGSRHRAQVGYRVDPDPVWRALAMPGIGGFWSVALGAEWVSALVLWTQILPCPYADKRAHCRATCLIDAGIERQVCQLVGLDSGLAIAPGAGPAPFGSAARAG